VSALLAAACALCLLAALRELWAERGEAVLRAGRRRSERLLSRLPVAGLGLERRLQRAGLAGRIDPRAVVGARAMTALAALPLALTLAGAAPGRLGPLVVCGLPPAAGLIPDLLIDRMARTRRERIAAGLPDALELMATAAGAGRGGAALIADAAAASDGPLAEELRRTRAELECGVSQGRALQGLGLRAGGELAGMAALLERSRRLGSPLAAGLQAQALSLREERARTIEELAARAAPKIQLVVALLLVPSVLLIVAAAVIANSDVLLGGL
jgi:tight adherence protein C